VHRRLRSPSTRVVTEQNAAPGDAGSRPLARVKRFDAQRRAELSCQHRLLLATFVTQASQVKHSCDIRERATSLRRRARDVAPGQCNNRGCTPCVNALELGTSNDRSNAGKAKRTALSLHGTLPSATAPSREARAQRRFRRAGDIAAQSAPWGRELAAAPDHHLSKAGGTVVAVTELGTVRQAARHSGHRAASTDPGAGCSKGAASQRLPRKRPGKPT